MEKQYFIQLLKKYLKGETTVEEDELITSYYNLFEREPEVLELLNHEEKEEIKNSIYSSIQDNITRQEHATGRLRTISGWVTRSAAAAVLLIAILSVVFLLNHRTSSHPPIASTVTDKKQNRVFHLPDGSIVVLDYGSKLNYATSFSQASTRDVYLEGQAFFDIHHDPAKPFIVHTGQVMTTVLGTAFNVKAEKDAQHITVTVTRGKVKVSDHHYTLDLLTPDQQLIYDRKTGSAMKSNVQANDFLQWTGKEDLAVEDMSFEETVHLLEDKFNTPITINDSMLKKIRFTTVLLKSENLKQILETICEFNGATWNYNKENSAIIINKK